VNETIKKQKDELAQQRLYKLYPLMGLPFPAPQMREWESTDKLFKTTAKFVSLEKDEVILEPTNGKQTSIELDVLRKEDQEYVQLRLEAQKETKP
jgi:hypothetical protein